MENNHQHHNNHSNRQYSFLEWLALVVCVIILAGVLWGVVRDITGLQREGYIRRYHRQAEIQISPNLRSWMTFSYVNQQFKLPANYLKLSLNITAKNYPNLAMSALASQQKRNVSLVLADVQKAVINYLSQPRLTQ